MKTISGTQTFRANPEEVFELLDNLGVVGMHMTRASMPMMGGKMNVQFLTEQKTGPLTQYRWSGTVLWWKLDFTVLVTKWIKGKYKKWETVGTRKLIIYSWFSMKLETSPHAEGSVAKLSISYVPAKGFFGRVLCFLVGDWYGKWCINNMLNDTESKLKHQVVQNSY